MLEQGRGVGGAPRVLGAELSGRQCGDFSLDVLLDFRGQRPPPTRTNSGDSALPRALGPSRRPLLQEALRLSRLHL